MAAKLPRLSNFYSNALMALELVRLHQWQATYQ
jgi:hypothetical protein